MGELVRDINGDRFELRVAQGSGESRSLSLREVVDRRGCMRGAVDAPGNHEAFVAVLRELDPLLPAAPSPDEARARVLAALEAGELELVPHVWHHRPVCDMVTEPAASLAEELDDDEEEVTATHTFEFELVDAQGNPVASEPYRVELPDGQVIEGRLNAQGAAMITGITTAGDCTLSFPRRADEDWAVA